MDTCACQLQYCVPQVTRNKFVLLDARIPSSWLPAVGCAYKRSDFLAGQGSAHRVQTDLSHNVVVIYISILGPSERLGAFLRTGRVDEVVDVYVVPAS